MIRWLVRKVVKYTLKELINSEDFKWLMHVHGPRRGNDAPAQKPGPALPRAEFQSDAVEVDSMKNIAAVMTGRKSDIEIAVKNESTTVSPNKERNADVIGRLSELGD